LALAFIGDYDLTYPEVAHPGAIVRPIARSSRPCRTQYGLMSLKKLMKQSLSRSLTSHRASDLCILQKIACQNVVDTIQRSKPINQNVYETALFFVVIVEHLM
jgi:hypothetical protein